MNKEMNNKGFSLVELIVVIAIMAILAVTLAPRLTQYIEKSRIASDKEVANTVFSAARLASAENVLEAGNYDLEDFGFTKSGDGATWTKGATSVVAGATGTFEADFMAVLSSFTLKESATDANATISITAVSTGAISVTLDADGTAGSDATPYTVSD